jgi:hypothetical protein
MCPATTTEKQLREVQISITTPLKDLKPRVRMGGTSDTNNQ